MDKKSLSETDIRTKFITPAILGASGQKWNVMTQVREEVYFTKGRVIVRGKRVQRGEAVLLMKILKPGGRAGLVLPDGTLFGEGVKTRIKEALLAECNLHTIVRLPNGVFNPYTGIRTNLLFFTKGQPTTEVWYYEHPYPPGAKSYNKGKPIRIEEFEAEKKWWGKPDKKGTYSKRQENEQAWRVSIEQLKAGNYNLDLKNPHSADAGPGDVDHLLPEYEKLLALIAETRGQLKAQLVEALSR